MISPPDRAHPIVSLLSALQAAIKRGDTDEINALRALIAQATRHPPLWRVFCFRLSGASKYIQKIGDSKEKFSSPPGRRERKSPEIVCPNRTGRGFTEIHPSQKRMKTGILPGRHPSKSRRFLVPNRPKNPKKFFPLASLALLNAPVGR